MTRSATGQLKQPSKDIIGFLRFKAKLKFQKVALIIIFLKFINSLAAGGQPHEVIAIKEGGDLDLNCPIRSVQSEDLIISWTCENEPANIKSSRIHVTDSGKLRIRSAKVGDSCNYRCEAADGIGTLSSIIKVIIVDRRTIDHLSKHNHSIQSPSRTFQPNESGQKSELVNGEPTSQLTERQPAPNDLEISMNPVSVHVDKNRTFSLECRVRYATHQRPPQIIWLKQFIGQKPNSPNEALEQNLVIIDSVYYHSLNWPRSVNYSPNSACANTALFIRQSSFVHSGKYICFAGYPPYTTSTLNLSSNTGDGLHPVNRPLKYKTAMAEVIVDDADGETNHRLKLEWKADEDGQRIRGSSKIFALLLLVSCGLIYAIKLIYARYKLRTKKRSVESGPMNMQIGDENHQDSPPLAIKRLQSPLIDSISYSNANANSANSDQSHCLQQTISIESQILDCDLKQTDTDEHLYSEIGERDKPSENSLNDYKIPNKVVPLNV